MNYGMRFVTLYRRQGLKKKNTRLVAFKSVASEKCHINSRESTARASAYILQRHTKGPNPGVLNFGASDIRGRQVPYCSVACLLYDV